MGGTTELAQVLRALTDATNAALTSAKSTADALRESMQLEKKSALNRLVKTPEVFRHDTHKEETRHFGEWIWSVKRWLESLDAQFSSELEYIEKRSQIEVSNDDMSDVTRDRSLALYSALATLVQGKAQRIVKSVRPGHGYEAYRILNNTFCPSNRQRAVAVLQSICTYPPFSEKVPLEESILAFEALTREYERASGHSCPDELVVATLMRCAPPAVRQFLYMRLQQETSEMSYEETRDLILNYDKASVIWKGTKNQDGMMVMLDSRQDDNMDVDRLQQDDYHKGKGKGKYDKGKGKGKGKYDKGKGKGKGDKGKSQQFGYGGGKGQQQEGYGKGKGKGDYAKGKGGGKGWQQQKGSWENSQKTCFKCGKPGHIAANCWSKGNNKGNVRQIDDASLAYRNETQTNNQQQLGNASSASSYANSSGASVRRVQMFELDTPRERVGLQRFRIDSEDDINQWTVNAIKLHEGSLNRHGSSCSWQQAREQHEFPGEQPSAEQQCTCVFHDLSCGDAEMECILGEGALQDHEDFPQIWKCDELYGWYLGEADSRCVQLCNSSGACEKRDTDMEGRVARISERLERVIIDTGADVSVAPLWAEKHGRLQSSTCAANIRNASGDKMRTSCSALEFAGSGHPWRAHLFPG